MMKPRNNISHYDAAEIHNHNQLKNYVKESIVKLAYHLIAFFIFLYCMISSLVAADGPTSRQFSPEDLL